LASALSSKSVTLGDPSPGVPMAETTMTIRSHASEASMLIISLATFRIRSDEPTHVPPNLCTSQSCPRLKVADDAPDLVGAVAAAARVDDRSDCDEDSLVVRGAAAGLKCSGEADEAATAGRRLRLADRNFKFLPERPLLLTPPALT